MKRRRYRHNKKPSEAQKQHVEQAGRPAFGRPAVVEPKPTPVKAIEKTSDEAIGDVTTPYTAQQNWAPNGGLVQSATYTSDIGGPQRHELIAPPPAPTEPPSRVSIELYVENTTTEDIILRHVAADDISVLVENSLIEPGRTRRVLMVLAKPGEEASREDGFMFCQGQAKNQCIVRCRGRTLWVALQSGTINPLMHDMTAFSNTSFTGQRYLLCFKPPFRSH